MFIEIMMKAGSQQGCLLFPLNMDKSNTRARTHRPHATIRTDTRTDTQYTHVKLKYIVPRIEILPFFHPNSFYWRASTAICRKEQKCFKFLIYMSVIRGRI